MKNWQKWAMAIVGGVALAAAPALAAVGHSPEGEALALTQGTIYVDADATGASDGSSWEDAYATLQPALDEAVAGDEIWVAAGTYTPTYQWDPDDPRTATFQLKNGVALYGGFDPSVGDADWDDRDWVANATILSGERGDPGWAGDNSYNVFYHPAGLSLGTAVLDGFSLTAGYAHSSDHERGGGMYNVSESPTVRNCTFEGNSAGYGGGMANYMGSSPTVLHCTFEGNEADVGGGIANDSASGPIVTDCTFSQNEASTGGGIANYGGSSGTVTDSRFVGNVASSTGGGMLSDHSSPRVTNCLFAGNTAISGGGIYLTYSSSKMVNCIFTGNTADSNGGGLMNDNASYPVVTNCTFSGNSGPNGGAIYDTYSATIVTNSILWGDTPNEIFTIGPELPTVSYSDVQGGYAGTANINEDPRLEDPANGDFRLLASSPCIDTGTNGAPVLPEEDFEGDPRIWDGDFDGTATADMGVDELAFHTLTLQVTGNGSGTVEQTPEGGRLEHMTVVTLTAVADPSSIFTGWSGDAAGITNPITLTMDTNKQVTATFMTYRVYLPLVVRGAP